MKMINIPDVKKLSVEELEKLLHEITLESRPVVDELCKRYKEIQQEQNLNFKPSPSH